MRRAGAGRPTAERGGRDGGGLGATPRPLKVLGALLLLGGAFEFFASWFMEVAFGVTAWDYTGTFMSVDGRTNFKFMCMWGCLGVFWIKLCLPRMLGVELQIAIAS